MGGSQRSLGEWILIRIYYMKKKSVFNKREKFYGSLYLITFESHVHYKFIQFNFLLLILNIWIMIGLNFCASMLNSHLFWPVYLGGEVLKPCCIDSLLGGLQSSSTSSQDIFPLLSNTKNLYNKRMKHAYSYLQILQFYSTLIF